MNTALFAESLEPDVVQLLVHGAQRAGLSVNAYLRNLIQQKERTMVSSGAEGTELVTSPTGVVVELGFITEEQEARARAVIADKRFSQMDPDEVTQRGREAWAREHGY